MNIRFALASVLVAACVSAAQAQATRTWVSGVGDDANPCSRTAPCKTFAGAISKTAAKGEINVLDPGGFGGVTITKSISIISEGNEAGVLVSGTNGVIINAAAADEIVLRGLEIEGVGTGLNGIRILNAGSVVVEDTDISDFTQAGISLESASATRLFVHNATISDNGIGLSVKAPGAAVNRAFVNGSRFFQNVTAGIKADGANSFVVLSDSYLSNASGGPDLDLANGGSVISYGDNVIRNGTPSGTAAYK